MILISIIVSLQMFFMTAGYFLVEPLRQEPEAPYNNATSSWLHRIPPPAEAGEFQTAGLIIIFVGIFHLLFFPNLIDFIKL